MPHTPQTTPPETTVLARWARLVVRHRWLALFATFIGTVGFGYATKTKLKVDTSVEAFLATQSDAFTRLEELRDDFGRDEMFMVVAEGDVFTMPFLENLRALHRELAAIDMPLSSLGQRKKDRTGTAAAPPSQANDPFADFGDFADDDGWGKEEEGTVIEEVTSLVNVRRTSFRDGSLVVEGLLDDWPSEADLPALKAFATHEPAIVERLLSSDARYALLTVRTDFMNEEDSNRVYLEIKRIVDRHRATGFTLRVGGIPALTAAMNTLMLGDLGKMAIGAMIFIVLVMAVTFRHPIGILGPVAVVVQAVFWCFGAMGLFGVKMTMISNILPAFILCVGIGDSVHILSVYRDARHDGLRNDDAIVRAVASTGIPVAFTTITTCIGLLSFRIAAVDAIRDMGTFGAFGVAMALLHSLMFLPALLTFNKTSLFGRPETPKEGKRDYLDRFIYACNGLSRPSFNNGKPQFHRRNATLLVAAGIAAVTAALALTLEVYHNPVSWIPSSFEVRDSFDTMDEFLGGTADMTVLVRTHEGKTIRDRELMLGLEKLAAHAKTYQDPRQPDTIGSTISAVDVVKESHRATHGGGQDAYAIPDTERGVADMLTLFENAGPEQLRRLSTVDLTRTIMVIRAKWMDATSYGPMVEHLQKGVDEYIGDKAVVELTGAILNVLTIVSSLLMDLLRSFSTAFVVITLVMVALLRDFRLGLISMVPNLLPVIMIMGFMAFTSIPIDLNTILLGSIAIGIAVDDTIHFLYQFRDHYQLTHDVEASIDHAFTHAGRAIVTTSIILAIGFAVFTAADMYNIVRFGLLISLTLTVAVLVDLIFTPALLRAVYRPPSSSTSPTEHPTSETAHEAT